MMRFSIALLLTLALQQKCNFLPTPQAISQQAEQGLLPYFPHVRTSLTPQGVMIGWTCADLGLEAIKEFPAMLDRNLQVQKLKESGGLVGIPSYGLANGHAMRIDER